MGPALQGAINNALVKLACVRVIVVIKAIRVTPTCCWVCILCRQVAAPPVVAALCLGTSLSLEIPVLHRGGKRQERAEMEQAVCICTSRQTFFFLLSLFWHGGSGTRKPKSFTSVFEWGSLPMQAHFQIPIPTTHIFIKAQGQLFIHERVWGLCVANLLSVDPCHYGSPSNKQLEAH